MREYSPQTPTEMYRGRSPVVGLIIDVTRHPRADRLYIATVDIDQPRNIPVVFGGERVLKQGEAVAVALPGTRLANGEHIRRRRWRGVVSGGELLSSDELGWTIGAPDEVVVLDPTECSIGQQLNNPQINWDLANASYMRENRNTIPYFLFSVQLYRGLPKGEPVVR